jgi:hypothetical protein
MYTSCLSLPADGRLELVPSIPSIPYYFAPKYQHASPYVTPTTATHSFIVIHGSATCLPPSIICHGMVLATFWNDFSVE